MPFNPRPTAAHRRPRAPRNARALERIQEAHALQELRERFPDWLIYRVPGFGRDGGWLAARTYPRDPAEDDLDVPSAAWEPTAHRLAQRIRSHKAVAAGVRTATSLPAVGGWDRTAPVRADLAPLSRHLLLWLRSRRSGQ